MSKFNFFLITLLFTSLSLFSSNDNEPVLLKSASTNPIDIPFEKWQFPNGLKVLIHEDNSDPLVHVHVTYHVGSNRETAGKSGFAHFFEHMMFQGSENVPDEKHFKIINDAGGNMNGNTTSDRTVYFQTVPSNYLETALWLEADRMGFLLNAVTPEKFENQRDAVKNEKYQNQISQQYGMSYEILGQNLYPPSHPYNWPVIGYVDDLDRATLEDLKNFFLRWYGPNNAILTITGDVKSEEVLPLVQKYFGSIPRGAEVRKLGSMIPRLSSDIYSGYTDNVYLPLTDIVFPTVPNYHKDEAPLDMLAALMGEGKKSIFYKNFVKSEKAIQASVGHPCRELSGEFHFTVLTFPDWQEDQGIYFNNIEADIRNTIAEWEEKGFSDEDLEMVKTEMISQSFDMKTSISSKASMISSWEWKGRGKHNVSTEINRYKNVTRADVMRVFNKYIKNRKAVINQVRPKSPFVKELDSLISRNPNANLILKEDPQYDNLIYNKSNSEFDACCRHTQPEATAPKTPKIPEFHKESFENGLKTIFSQTNEVPKVYIRLKINGGSLLEDSKKTGLSDFTAQMMNESTLKKSSEDISVELQKLGSTVTFSSEDDMTVLFIECLSENYSKTLDIVEEKLLLPAFNDEDFKRIKKSNVEGLESMKKNSQYLAGTAMSNVLFGDSPFGRSMTEKSIKKIKVMDVKEFYNNYSPNISELVAVGNISKDDFYKELDFLRNWENKNISLPSNFEFPEDNTTQIYLLDKEGASQSFILMGHKSNTFDTDGEFFKSQIMNKSLGGGASGRLFLNLREDKGFTYGAYSFYQGNKQTGMFGIQTSVKTEVTDSALTEIFSILDNYTNTGLTNEELSSTKESYLNSAAMKYETPNQKLGFLNRILTYDLDPSYIDKQADILNDMTLTEVNSLASSKIKPNEMAIVIVGNKYLIKKKLENLSSNKDGMKFDFKINEIKY
ncbi:MAG: insulinase family protein [Flavobacteriales bacterium]|nr:insulinase family protein [Flavobacteriales bacterium]